MNYLTDRQVELLIKLYYSRKYKTASEVLGITISKIKTIEESALRCIRVAYSESYRQKKEFNGETVLRHMAERAGITAEEITKTFDSYTSNGFDSPDRPYWERVKRKGELPTAAKLLDFFYMKYELKIDCFIFR